MGGQFRYAVTGTLSRYVNEMTKLADDVEEQLIMGGQRQMNYTRAQVGTAFPEFYGYVVEGVFQSEQKQMPIRPLAITMPPDASSTRIQTMTV
jgi:TonB-dependent starch-binding outer membrane protein SusC